MVVYSGSQKRGPVSLYERFDFFVADTNPDFHCTLLAQHAVFVRIVDHYMESINYL